MPSTLENIVEWKEADAVVDSLPRLMWMQDHFLTAALSSKSSAFRKYFIEDALSETRLLPLILQFEGMLWPVVLQDLWGLQEAPT